MKRPRIDCERNNRDMTEFVEAYRAAHKDGLIPVGKCDRDLLESVYISHDFTGNPKNFYVSAEDSYDGQLKKIFFPPLIRMLAVIVDENTDRLHYSFMGI